MYDIAQANVGHDLGRSARDAQLSLLAQGISLADLARGVEATVLGVIQATTAEDHDLTLRLIEIGFVPGESVRVIAHGNPGREPIAVRLGGTTFALRRFEADYVRVLTHGAAAPR